jgi:hypothetical protein
MSQSANPLKQFFRQPAIYLKLTSNGHWWPNGSLDMPVNQELPVYPMTAIDDITYRTPDALFNGQATVSVIQSCVPNIKDAWKMPVVDLNPLLIAIRIASSGHIIELKSNCPSCGEENEYEVDLRTVLSQQPTTDYSKPISHMDMEIYFIPMSYENQNKINILQFDQQRAMIAVGQSTSSETEKTEQLNQILTNITKITIEAIKYSIGSIRTPQALVNEPEFIEEFLNNCDRNLFNKIKEHVVDLRESTDLKPLSMTCAHCSHQYDQEFSLDSSNFFD